MVGPTRAVLAGECMRLDAWCGVAPVEVDAVDTVDAAEIEASCTLLSSEGLRSNQRRFYGGPFLVYSLAHVHCLTVSHVGYHHSRFGRTTPRSVTYSVFVLVSRVFYCIF